MNQQRIICIDFDGTCVTHDFPKMGKDIGAVPVLKRLVGRGHKLILWTMRSSISGVSPVTNKIENGGIVFTFSCSQVVDRNMFNSTIHTAAIESGKKISILHHLNQPPDHPANIYFPEGVYLKGLVLYVQ